MTMLDCRRPRGEEGVAATALLVTALLVALAAFVRIALPFGAASDVKAGNRTAADAAALAGAKDAHDRVLDMVRLDGLPRAWTSLRGTAGLGADAAAEYAARNDGALVSYSFDIGTGRARVTVTGPVVEGTQSRSNATAQLALPRCDIADLPEPPAPGPPGGPEPPPPQLPDVVEADCGGLRLQLRPVERDGEIRLLLTAAQLSSLGDLMKVRLVA